MNSAHRKDQSDYFEQIQKSLEQAIAAAEKDRQEKAEKGEKDGKEAGSAGQVNEDGDEVIISEAARQYAERATTSESNPAAPAAEEQAEAKET
ncbi:MAG: hypothetical protein KID09_09720 [Paenibacillus macerans]|nr:hypothetical protein [Paenibacillus macerans]